MRQVRIAVEGLLTRRAHRGDDLAGRFGAEAEGISADFRRKLAALPANMTALERAAAIRALKDERDAALHALRERREVERYGDKASRQTRGPLGPRLF